MAPKEIILTIEGHRYRVNEFVDKHPGEGIRDVYLHNYRNKDVTEEFMKSVYEVIK